MREKFLKKIIKDGYIITIKSNKKEARFVIFYKRNGFLIILKKLPTTYIE